jgi:hypothetical protein
LGRSSIKGFDKNFTSFLFFPLSNGIRHTGHNSRRGDGVDKIGVDNGCDVDVSVGDVEVVTLLPRRFRAGVKSEDINRRTALKSEKREAVLQLQII